MGKKRKKDPLMAIVQWIVIIGFMCLSSAMISEGYKYRDECKPGAALFLVVLGGTVLGIIIFHLIIIVVVVNRP